MVQSGLILIFLVKIPPILLPPENPRKNELNSHTVKQIILHSIHASQKMNSLYFRHFMSSLRVPSENDITFAHLLSLLPYINR